jgi:hypothetical protein
MARVRCVLGILLLAALGGRAPVRPFFYESLAVFDPTPKPPVLSAASFTNPECRRPAEQRAADAAADGIDAGLQARIPRDVYDSCVAMEKPHRPFVCSHALIWPLQACQMGV